MRAAPLQHRPAAVSALAPCVHASTPTPPGLRGVGACHWLALAPEPLRLRLRQSAKCPSCPTRYPEAHPVNATPPRPRRYGPLAGGTLTDKYFAPGQQPGENARHVKVRSCALAPSRPQFTGCGRVCVRVCFGTCPPSSAAPHTLPSHRRRPALSLCRPSPPAVPRVPGAVSRRPLHGGGRQVSRAGRLQGPEPGGAGAGLVQVPLVRGLHHHWCHHHAAGNGAPARGASRVDGCRALRLS